MQNSEKRKKPKISRVKWKLLLVVGKMFGEKYLPKCSNFFPHHFLSLCEVTREDNILKLKERGLLKVRLEIGFPTLLQ